MYGSNQKPGENEDALNLAWFGFSFDAGLIPDQDQVFCSSVKSVKSDGRKISVKVLPRGCK